MRITVSGKQINVGDALKQYVEENLERAVSKYFDRAIEADVVFYKESHLYCADIMVNEGTGSGILIKSDAKTDDIYASFDMALDRVEKQLRRYKRKLKNHHKVKQSEVEAEIQQGMVSAKKYVISEKDEEEEAEDSPLIIAEKPTVIEKLSVSDAVMRMNLANLPALMFINKQNGQINVVYRRKDGNISWVDPQNKSAAA